MKISSAFNNGDKIPAEYTCDGENIMPELNITDIPANTKSLVLIIDDPDAPSGTFTHLVAWNIEPSAKIKKGSLPGTSGKNDFGRTGYGGPCPPSGIHHYYFKTYALDKKLELTTNAKKAELEKSMKGHVLAEAKIVGLYSRNG